MIIMNQLYRKYEELFKEKHFVEIPNKVFSFLKDNEHIDKYHDLTKNEYFKTKNKFHELINSDEVINLYVIIHQKANINMDKNSDDFNILNEENFYIKTNKKESVIDYEINSSFNNDSDFSHNNYSDMLELIVRNKYHVERKNELYYPYIDLENDKIRKKYKKDKYNETYLFLINEYARYSLEDRTELELIELKKWVEKNEDNEDTEFEEELYKKIESISWFFQEIHNQITIKRTDFNYELKNPLEVSEKFRILSGLNYKITERSNNHNSIHRLIIETKDRFFYIDLHNVDSYNKGYSFYDHSIYSAFIELSNEKKIIPKNLLVFLSNKLNLYFLELEGFVLSKVFDKKIFKEYNKFSKKIYILNDDQKLIYNMKKIYIKQNKVFNE